MDDIKQALIAAGWRIGDNALANRENLATWYAWMPVRPEGLADCECNDKPPSVIVYPHHYEMSHGNSKSCEVKLTGERGGKWWQLMCYSVSPDELMASLPTISERLGRAWNALGA